jgi:hypothetical protein
MELFFRQTQLGGFLGQLILGLFLPSVDERAHLTDLIG